MQTKRSIILNDREKLIRECAGVILKSIKEQSELVLEYPKYVISAAYRLLLFERFIRRNGSYSLTDYGEAKIKTGFSVYNSIKETGK